MALDVKITCVKTAFNLAVQCRFPLEGISGVYGSSGIGKTSLLRCIAGLEHPSDGSITTNNEVWFDQNTQKSPQQRHIGFVFQDSRLFSHLSVFDNLALAQRQIPQPILTIETMAQQFNITDLLTMSAAKLSVGQQQRIAIVRSLIAQPYVLLLDEPLAALDSINKHHMMSQLKQHSVKYKLPMIYVSHSAQEIDFLCDNLLILNPCGNHNWGPAKQLLTNANQLPLPGNVVDNNDSSQQVTLALTPKQYNNYKETGHLLLSPLDTSSHSTD